MLPVRNLWIHVSYKALFCFAEAFEDISDGSRFISLLPFKRNLIRHLQLKRLSSPSHKKAVAVMFMTAVKPLKCKLLTFPDCKKILIEIIRDVFGLVE